jgi:predicted MFS family arabinose efflux permease
VTFPLIMLVALLNHSSFKGAKLLISLSAIEIGASPAEIGVLYAAYAVFPILLSFYAGGLSDRLGFRLPVTIASFGVVASLMLPFIHPSLATLFACSMLAGICNIFYVVAVQHAVGTLGEGAARTRNYSLLSFGVAVSSLIGPVLTGFAVDSVGHRATFPLLAALPATAAIALLSIRVSLPRPRHAEERRSARRGIIDLIGNPRLRRVLIATAFLEAGMELFNFLMPIYGHSIGLSASQIGIVMGTFALALMSVRVILPMVVRRWGDERVFALSMFLAAAAYCGLSFAATLAPLLGMSFLLGLGLGVGAPLSMALSYNRSPEGRAGEALGLRQTMTKSMEASMPVLFGFLSVAWGFLPVYWLGALLVGCGGWLMARDAGRKDREQ